MNKAIEKILEELEKYKYSHLVERDYEQLMHCKEVGDCSMLDCSLCIFDKAIKIVQQVVEEYNNGWILCSERIPETGGQEVLATLESGYGLIRVTAILTGNRIGTFLRCNHREFDMKNWNIIAWQPLPEPYHPKEETEV